METAWNMIATTFERVEATIDEEVGALSAPTVALFTERLLRSIFDMTAEQQLRLVIELAITPYFTKRRLHNPY